MPSGQTGHTAAAPAPTDKIGIDYVNERLSRFVSDLESLNERARSAADRMFGSDAPTPASKEGPQLVSVTTTNLLEDIQRQLASLDYQLSRLVS